MFLDEGVTTTSFTGSGEQTSPSQSNHNLDTEDYVITNTVLFVGGKDPLGLVEEIGQELEQQDHLMISDTQASPDLGQQEAASPSHQPQQQEGAKEVKTTHNSEQQVSEQVHEMQPSSQEAEQEVVINFGLEITKM